MKINEVTTSRITNEKKLLQEYPFQDWVEGGAGLARLAWDNIKYQDADPIELAKKKWYDPEKFVGQATGKKYMAEDESLTNVFINMAVTGTLFGVMRPILGKLGGRLGSFIPGAGVAVGLYFAGKSLKKGDYVGAVLDVLLGMSGGAVITAKIGIGIFVWMIIREVHKVRLDVENAKFGAEAALVGYDPSKFKPGDSGYRAEFHRKEATYPIEGVYNDIMNLPNENPESYGDSITNTFIFFKVIWNMVCEYISAFFSGIEFGKGSMEISDAKQISGMSEEQADLAMKIFEATHGEDVKKHEKGAIDALMGETKNEY